MNDTDFLALLMRFQDAALAPDEVTALEAAMRVDASKRQLFADTQLRSMSLPDRFRQEAFQSGFGASRTPTERRFRWFTRPIPAMAAGLIIGLFSASILWAISSPKATTERLFSLLNGSFDENRLELGFPRQIGGWSGDEAAISNGQIRFIAPGSDSGDPTGRAISCDVFQLVDLRPLQHELNREGDSVLELSADFRDGRAAGQTPSVSFFCKLYLFSGDSASVHQNWPQDLSKALASGGTEITTHGSDGQGMHTLTAKCLIPVQAEFAVIQIAARPNVRPAQLDELSADNVKLTLKTHPALPIRIVQR